MLQDVAAKCPRPEWTTHASHCLHCVKHGLGWNPHHHATMVPENPASLRASAQCGMPHVNRPPAARITFFPQAQALECHRHNAVAEQRHQALLGPWFEHQHLALLFDTLRA